MKILSPLRGNPFSDPRIRETRLRTYTVAHIANLAADPRFTGIAEATAEVHAACYGATAEAATRDTVAQARRVRMEVARKDFLALMSQHEGTIRGLWGRNSEQYLRFYPAGASEYHNANLQNIDEKLKRYETAALEFAAELPPIFLKAFLAEPTEEDAKGGVIPRFRAARGAQLKALGAKTQGKIAAGSERKALEKRLYRNVLLVTAELIDASPEELEAAEQLFPVHRLFKKKRPVKKAAKPSKDEEAQDDQEEDDDDGEEAEATASTTEETTAAEAPQAEAPHVTRTDPTPAPSAASGEEAGDGSVLAG